MRSTSTSSPARSEPPRRSSSSFAARQASWTAPAVIQVCLEADDEPAESTAAVECGATTTFSSSSSVRATCAITLTTPWPTSAAAAFPAGRVARAAGKADGIAREVFRLRDGNVGAAADHLRDRERAGDPLAGREGVAGRERVPQAQLHRVELERRGELVHLRLGGKAGLNGPEAAHRAAGRVVRVDAGRVDQRVGDGVGAAGKGGGVRTDGGRARRVGAAVQEDAGADADELAVAACAVLHPDARRVPVDVADERLLPVVDELDGAAGVEGEHGAVNLHGEILAPTEGAAHAGEVDAHLLPREAEA